MKTNQNPWKKTKNDENQTKTITKNQHTCKTNQKPSENHDNHETMEPK